jgi:hypothetical protein
MEQSTPEGITESEHAARGVASGLERVAVGQRRINVLWEVTQGVIAAVMVLTLAAAVLLQIELPTQFWVLAAIVVNAYFQRTNHTRVGGVGPDAVGR